MKLPQSIQLERYENQIILAIGIILAAILRFSLREFESGDFRNFLGPWYEVINQYGGIGALKYEFSNYTPPYLYLLVIASYLFSGFSAVVAIKLVSIFFDFVCASFVYKIVQLKYPTGTVPIFAFFATLFAPTVFLNSAFWGQSDVIYTTALIACIYFLVIGREIPAFIAFGVAFAFKLQAVFLIPLLLILLLKRYVALTSFLAIPIVYIVAILPAFFMGRPFFDLMFIYVNQTNYYEALSKNAPNLYQWFPNQLYDIFYPAGIIWTLAIIFLLSVGIYKSKARITSGLIIQLATISVVIMPYFLPKMHDRYFFAADVISIIFAFYFPRYFFIPIIIGMVSLFSYFPFLFGQEVIPLSLLAVVLAVTIIFLLRHLFFTPHPMETN